MRPRQHQIRFGRSRFVQWNKIEVDFNAGAGTSPDSAGSRGHACTNHILDAKDGLPTHRLEACLEQQLVGEWIPLRGEAIGWWVSILTTLRGLWGKVGPPPGSVAVSSCTNVDDGIADTNRLAIIDLFAPDQSESEGVDNRIVRISAVEAGLTADGWDPDGVAVVSKALHD